MRLTLRLSYNVNKNHIDFLERSYKISLKSGA
jgi:hypothetical protein